ncbi:decarboxylating 6-phosphogluconate dehydrogenase [Patescibacteria group bacterium]|nr:decarboxylating 6-phosphogluconate dehydrogenase [Patescibacteria group bacterium]
MNDKKEILIIGLGKMGFNIALNLKDKGVDVFGFSLGKDDRENASREGVKVKDNIKETLELFEDRKKIVWIMVPQGSPVDEVLYGKDEGIVQFLRRGDTVIDGGNSYYKDSIKRYNDLKDKGINFFDCGTSGGMRGARNGACLMIGGDRDEFKEIEWIFENMATKDGYFYVGESGSGHYVKMIHNAIEYGMMQSIAEGLNLVKNGRYNGIDLEGLLNVWGHGSIIESFLIDTLKTQISQYSDLSKIEPFVNESGEGSWAVSEAVEKKVPFSAISMAYFERLTSLGNSDDASRFLSLMRNGFGGHEMNINLEEDKK